MNLFIIYPETGKYPFWWASIANKVKAEANFQCKECDHGDDKANGYQLTVHHKNHRKNDCRRSNLVALCQRCHMKEVGRYRQEQLTIKRLNTPLRKLQLNLFPEFLALSTTN